MITLPPPKYAQIERERRFLVAQLPFSEESPPAYVQISDTYLLGGQLRLRLTRNEAGEPVSYKLTQKRQRPDLPSSAVLITTMYLTADEYGMLCQLPGTMLQKRRYHWDYQGTHYGIDLFGGTLAGLILAEVEADSDAALAQLPIPVFALREVTSDPAFRGGALAQLTPEAFQHWQTNDYWGQQ